MYKHHQHTLYLKTVSLQGMWLMIDIYRCFSTESYVMWLYLMNYVWLCVTWA